MIRITRKGARALGFAAAVFWMLGGLLGIVRWIAGDAGLLSGEMLRHAPPQYSGLPAEAYPDTGRMVADYLTGRRETFQLEWPDESGEPVERFQAHEAAHMADCRQLIALDETVMWISLSLAGTLSAAAFLLRSPRKEFSRGIFRSLGAMAFLMTVLLCWAVADFEGFFITFHRVAFTNEGWLLNPRTDLLIRLMPADFFIALGLRGILPALAVPLILAGVALGMLGKRGEDT